MNKINRAAIVLLFLLLLQTNCISQPVKDTATGITVSLKGNGYTYDGKGETEVEYIDSNGLANWKNAAVFTRVFFYPKHAGKITVALKIKSPGGASLLSVTLDNSLQHYVVKAKQSTEYIEVPVGAFTIDSARYHYLQINGITKSGNSFPDVEAVVIKGTLPQNLISNTTHYRGSPSTHLWYQYPKDSAIAWFYDEVTVPVGVDAVNAYYMTNGFADGYMGIQVNSKTERRFIFSIWSNFNTNNPKEIPAEYAVRLLKKGDGVFAEDFGNEGSGGHSHLIFNWKNGTAYKLLVSAKAAGDHTIFTGYYFAPETGKWKLIAQWDKTKTGGALLSGLYSFVENFGSNGGDYFKAEYGNQWICTSSGTWIELNKCSLTSTAGPEKHPRYDYGAGVEDNKFYMYTGGYKQINNLAAKSVIQREPQGEAPAINFSALPDK